MVVLLGFDLNDAVLIGIIGVVDGLMFIFVVNILYLKYMGVIMVVVYFYMVLVLII